MDKRAWRGSVAAKELSWKSKLGVQTVEQWLSDTGANSGLWMHLDAFADGKHLLHVGRRRVLR